MLLREAKMVDYGGSFSEGEAFFKICCKQDENMMSRMFSKLQMDVDRGSIIETDTWSGLEHKQVCFTKAQWKCSCSNYKLHCVEL